MLSKTKSSDIEAARADMASTSFEPGGMQAYLRPVQHCVDTS